MIFLIDYDRRAGRLVQLGAFANAARDRAEDARLELELELNGRGADREIVILEADDEHALRRTHRRYFEDLAGIATRAVNTTQDG